MIWPNDDRMNGECFSKSGKMPTGQSWSGTDFLEYLERLDASRDACSTSQTFAALPMIFSRP